MTPQLVIASPQGAAISLFMGLLRRPTKRGTPRNDKLLIAFVLVIGVIEFVEFFGFTPNLNLTLVLSFILTLNLRLVFQISS